MQCELVSSKSINCIRDNNDHLLERVSGVVCRKHCEECSLNGQVNYAMVRLDDLAYYRPKV